MSSKQCKIPRRIFQSQQLKLNGQSNFTLNNDDMPDRQQPHYSYHGPNNENSANETTLNNEDSYVNDKTSEGNIVNNKINDGFIVDSTVGQNNDAINKYLADIHHLNKALQDSRWENEILRYEMKGREREMKEEYNELQQQLYEAQDSYKQMTKKCHQLTIELDSCRPKLAKSEEEVTKLQLEITNLHKKSEDELLNLTKNFRATEEELDKKTKVLSEIQTELDEVRINFNDTKCKLEVLEEQREILSNQLISLTAENKQLYSENSDKENSVKLLENEIKQLKVLLEEKTDDLKSIENYTKQSATVHDNEPEDKLGLLHSTKDSLLPDNKNLKRESENQRNEFKKHKAKLKGDLSKVKQVQDVIREYKEKISLATSTNEEIEKKLASANLEKIKLNKKNKILKENCDELKNELDKLQTEIGLLSKKLSINESKDMLRNKDLKKLRENEMKLINDMKTLKTASEGLADLLREKQLHIEDLQRTIIEMRTPLLLRSSSQLSISIALPKLTPRATASSSLNTLVFGPLANDVFSYSCDHVVSTQHDVAGYEPIRDTTAGVTSPYRDKGDVNSAGDVSSAFLSNHKSKNLSPTVTLKENIVKQKLRKITPHYQRKEQSVSQYLTSKDNDKNSVSEKNHHILYERHLKNLEQANERIKTLEHHLDLIYKNKEFREFVEKQSVA